MDWRKATYSMNNGNCVEAASGVLVRDTMDPLGVQLSFTPKAWETFLNGIKHS